MLKISVIKNGIRFSSNSIDDLGLIIRHYDVPLEEVLYSKKHKNYIDIKIK